MSQVRTTVHVEEEAEETQVKKDHEELEGLHMEWTVQFVPS